MCLARSTPHTGSSGAQGLWSEFTAKPQLAAPKGSTGPPGLSEASGLVSRRVRRLLGLPARTAPDSGAVAVIFGFAQAKQA